MPPQVLDFGIVVDHHVHVFGMEVHVTLVIVLRGIESVDRHNLRDDGLAENIGRQAMTAGSTGGDIVQFS